MKGKQVVYTARFNSAAGRGRVAEFRTGHWRVYSHDAHG